jgi:hypothetical protein
MSNKLEELIQQFKNQPESSKCAVIDELIYMRRNWSDNLDGQEDADDDAVIDVKTLKIICDIMVYINRQ